MAHGIYRGLLQQAAGGGGGGCGVVLANVADDNFDCGASVDTAGTRFSGATPWTVFNHRVIPVVTSYTQSGGILSADPGSATANMDPHGYTQPLPVGDFTYVAKMKPLTMTGSFGGMGLLLRESATGKILAGTLIPIPGPIYGGEVRRMTSTTNWTASYNGVFGGGAAGTDHWVQVKRVGSTLTFRASTDGVSFTDIAAGTAQTADFTTAPDQIGIFVNQTGSGTALLGEFDSFARTA